MKRVSRNWLPSLVLACACFSMPGWASANIYYVSGTVDILVVQDSAFGPDGDWFTLGGVGPQGDCGAGGIGTEMGIFIKDDQNGSRQFSMVLAAWTAEKGLSVRVDDTYKNASGGCYAEFIY